MIRHVATPGWVYLGGLALALTAGIINAVGFLGIHHQALSHMTGSVTMMGMELTRGHYDVAWHAFAILAAFFLGCLLSGMIIQQSSLRLSRRYGVALTCESVALFLAVYRLNQDYVMLLFRDPLGKKMLIGTIVLQLMGAWMIRKIVNIKV